MSVVGVRKVNKKGFDMNNLGAYRKTITAVITGLIGWVTVVVTSTPTAVVASEWIMLATVMATALGVYSVSNQGA